jgi:signal transduction histidine kinase
MAISEHFFPAKRATARATLPGWIQTTVSNKRMLSALLLAFICYPVNAHTLSLIAEQANSSLALLILMLLISLLFLAVRQLHWHRQLLRLTHLLQNPAQDMASWSWDLGQTPGLSGLLTSLQQREQEHLQQLQEARDHNHQMAAEQQRMIEANDLLEQGVAQRNRELDEKTREVTETLHALLMTRQQLLEKEQLAMIGELVAGLAHEVNTPLAIGSSTLDSLIHELDPTRLSFPQTHQECESMLQHIVDSISLAHSNIERAADTVCRFKEVSVDQASGQEREFEIGHYLHSVVWSLRPHYRYRPIEISIDCPDPLYITDAPGLYAQIITNLTINALDHAFDKDQPGHIRIVAIRAGEHLCLCFSDNGKGMDQQTLEKIFEPFFTTRRQDGGSGLGAHIVYDLLVNQLKGNIKLESEPGKGTRYQMLIPCEIRGRDAYNAPSVFEEYCKC